MGQRFVGGPPKILGLIERHRANPEAFEATLIGHGLRWRDVGSARFTWGDCWALIYSLPYDSPLHRAENPKEWFWYNPMNDVLVGVYDALGVIAATQDRRPKIKKNEIPKPTLRPWDKTRDVEKIGSTPRPISELNALLGW